MKNVKISIIALSLLLGGCTVSQAKHTLVFVKGVGCVVVTEESRAEIRSKQNVKTNICDDKLNK